MENELLLLLLNLIFTMFIYLLLPIIIILIGKKYPLSLLKRIAIINGIAVRLTTAIYLLETTGEVSRSSAFVLWSYVGYRLMKRRCLEEHPLTSRTNCSSATVNSSSDNSDGATEIHEDEGKLVVIDAKQRKAKSKFPKRRYCKYCGNLIDNTTKKCTGCGRVLFKFPHLNKYIVAILSLSVLVVFSLSFNIYNTHASKTKIKQLTRMIEANKKVYYESNSTTLYPYPDVPSGYITIPPTLQVESVGDNVVFVIDEENEHYFTLKQLKKVTAECGAFTFHAIYKNDAIKQGYKKYEKN